MREVDGQALRRCKPRCLTLGLSCFRAGLMHMQTDVRHKMYNHGLNDTQENSKVSFMGFGLGVSVDVAIFEH